MHFLFLSVLLPLFLYRPPCILSVITTPQIQHSAISKFPPSKKKISPFCLIQSHPSSKDISRNHPDSLPKYHINASSLVVSIISVWNLLGSIALRTTVFQTSIIMALLALLTAFKNFFSLEFQILPHVLVKQHGQVLRGNTYAFNIDYYVS